MENGKIHIYTGDGKGKTTAAVGLALRAAGQGKEIYFYQFLKGRNTGEVESFKGMNEITFSRANPDTKKFFYQMNNQEKEELREDSQKSWQEFIDEVITFNYDIIIIDEVMAAITNKLIDLDQVIELISKKSKEQELVLTGRNAPAELIELADYVTEMKMIKHPYQKNCPPRKGIEF
ncbi:MAG: cob(I)yrinic acid a,c-diamide adenosyltransferase [Halanaerobiaceae bacterium]